MFDGSPATLAFVVVIFLVACDNQTGGYVHSTGSLAEKSYCNHYNQERRLSSGSVVNNHAGDGSYAQITNLSRQGAQPEPISSAAGYKSGIHISQEELAIKREIKNKGTNEI